MWVFYTGGKDMDGPLKICLIGQPNGGKSAIVNSLFGEKRVRLSSNLFMNQTCS